VREIGIFAVLYTKNMLIKINMRINGNNNNIQEITGAPALQIRFRTQVQMIM
jgi:hypothetical protein